MPIRWIHAGRVSHYRSQSIYHGLAYAQTPQTPNTVVVSIPEDPYLCIGYFQEAAKEVDLDFCKSRNLPVIRRETGGGTVYIDSGQVFVQWICQPGFLPRKVEHRFQHFNKTMIETYSFFGIQAYHHPVNDVHVDGKKIVGTGAATIGNAEVVTGNFMFDFNTEITARALKIPNESFRSAIKSSLDTYITWMNRELANPPSYEEVIRQYKLNCEQLLGLEMAEGDFTDEELEAIAKVEERLQQEDWLHSVKSSGSRNRLVKIHAGVWVGWMHHEAADMSVQIFSQMRNDHIEMIRIFLPDSVKPSWSTGQLEQALVSASMSEKQIGERLIEFFSKVDERDRLMPMQDWTNAVMSIRKEVQKVSGHA